ncbi:hypothetical protein EON79_03090 [bacterium]|nr:MAG: hypothetical protein EON79_03090 [bacterium]
MRRWEAVFGVAMLGTLGYAFMQPWLVGGGCGSVQTRRAYLRQVATGIAIYTEDSEGRIPPMAWRPALEPYLKPGTQPIFEDRKVELPYIFALRASLVETKISTLKKPESVALVFDVLESSDPYVAELPALASRKDPKSGNPMALIAFGDLRVKLVPRSSLKTIR